MTVSAQEHLVAPDAQFAATSMKLSLLRVLAPLALVALVLAGCGSADHPARLARGVITAPGVRPVGTHVTDRPRFDHRRTHPGATRRLVIQRLDIPKDPPLDPTLRLRAESRQILSTTIAGQRVVIVIPRDSRHRAILFEHGSGESADLDVDLPPSELAIAALVRDGYTWAESNAGFNNWGDEASLRDDVAVARWLRHHGDPLIDIGGDSMGGLDATQLIPLVHPAAVFELYPVCDERTVVDEFGNLMHLADAPLRRLSPVAMHDVSGLPMLFTASPQDTIVPKATNADICAREARAAGARVEEVTTTGQHGAYSNWRPWRLIHFLNGAARREHRRSRHWSHGRSDLHAV